MFVDMEDADTTADATASLAGKVKGAERVDLELPLPQNRKLCKQTLISQDGPG